MALQDHLTISDYLAATRNTLIRNRASGMSQGTSISQQDCFGKILSSCLKSDMEDDTRMTAADYLAKPIQLNTRALIKCMKSSFRLERNEVSPIKWERLDAEESDNELESMDQYQAETDPSEPSDIIEKSIRNAAQKYDLPTELIRGVIKAESGFQVLAESAAGAKGLMQLMPATARELGVKDIFDVEQNIDGGSRYLKNMMNRFDNDIEKALSAYNAGPGTVERYGGIPPYKETVRYVKKVLEYSGMTA